MIQCLQKPVKASLGAWAGFAPLTQTGPPLARAAQPAGGIAGHHIALLADPAHVDTLVELPGVVGGIARGDAKLLLRGVLRLLAGGKACRKRHQTKQTSPSHGPLSLVRALGTAVTRLGQTAGFTTIGGHNWFCKIVLKMSAKHQPNAIHAPATKFPNHRATGDIVTRFDILNDAGGKPANINTGVHWGVLE